MIAGLKFDIFCKEENLGGLTLSKCAGPFLALAIIAYSFCALDELDVSSAHHGLHSPLRLNHNASSRPRVVVMIPARKGLHGKIVEKAALALRALETGNPELDLYTFVFDKIIPMCAAAPARPVLTFPDSNTVAASGGTGGRCPRWRGCATSCWILSRSSGTTTSCGSTATSSTSPPTYPPASVTCARAPAWHLCVRARTCGRTRDHRHASLHGVSGPLPD